VVKRDNPLRAIHGLNMTQECTIWTREFGVKEKQQEEQLVEQFLEAFQGKEKEEKEREMKRDIARKRRQQENELRRNENL